MGDLTTLAAYKAYSGKTNNDSDALLQTLITQVSSAVESYVGYPLLTATYSETYDGNGASALFLSKRPVTAVSVLEINGIAVLPSASYFDAGYVIDPKMVYLRNRVFALGARNVFITYTAGYSNVGALPADIVGVVNETVNLRFKERDWAGYRSKSLAGETITFETSQFNKNALAVLQHYKAVAVS